MFSYGYCLDARSERVPYNSLWQIFPLHLSRSIGTIANWSIVSVMLLPVILLTVIIRCPWYASEHASPVTIVGPDVLGSLGIMAFAFGCAQVKKKSPLY
jgi:sodium-coupled neutral amino acid transporter 11